MKGAEMMEATYFQQIIGHDMLKQQLTQLVQNGRLPHALIFAGPAGVGKTMMACALASFLIGRPVFATLAAQQAVPLLADQDDAFYLGPVGAMLKVDQFRQLQSQLILEGKTGQYRVAIIDHVETMNTEFANRMLKILEEPPPGVVFILITDQPALLLPTIISRCAMIHFDPVPDEEMIHGLVRLRGDTRQDYEKAVLWGDGIVSAVLEFLQGTGQDSVTYALEFLQITATHACPYAKWLTVSMTLSDDMTRDVLRWLRMFVRDMVVLRSGAANEYIRLKQYRDDMVKLLPYWNDAGLFRLLHIVEEGQEGLTRHVNTRLIWDYVSLQCINAKGGD